VHGFDFGVGGGAPRDDEGQLRSSDDVVTRAQNLIDSPRPYDGYPIEWHLEALNVGDLTAIATIALRAENKADSP
jgi:hypothetical protein